MLRCEGSSGVGSVWLETGGKTYAINGLARGQATGAPIEAIWAPNPEVAGLRKDIGPLIDDGLRLCS